VGTTATPLTATAMTMMVITVNSRRLTVRTLLKVQRRLTPAPEWMVARFGVQTMPAITGKKYLKWMRQMTNPPRLLDGVLACGQSMLGFQKRVDGERAVHCFMTFPKRS
jgi:hypothetical protein